LEGTEIASNMQQGKPQNRRGRLKELQPAALRFPKPTTPLGLEGFRAQCGVKSYASSRGRSKSKFILASVLATSRVFNNIALIVTKL
jgi:hypothetical protein